MSPLQKVAAQLDPLSEEGHKKVLKLLATCRLCLQKVAAQLDPLSEEGHREVLNYMRFADHHLRLDPDSFAGWEHLAREHVQCCAQPLQCSAAFVLCTILCILDTRPPACNAQDSSFLPEKLSRLDSFTLLDHQTQDCK